MSRCNNLVVAWEADLNQCIGTPFNPLRVLLTLILLYYKVEIATIKGHFKWSSFRFSINTHEARPILRKIFCALNHHLNLLKDLEFYNNLCLTALRKISSFTYKSHLIESLFVKSPRQTLIVTLGMLSQLISHLLSGGEHKYWILGLKNEVHSIWFLWTKSPWWMHGQVGRGKQCFFISPLFYSRDSSLSPHYDVLGNRFPPRGWPSTMVKNQNDLSGYFWSPYLSLISRNMKRCFTW